MPRARLLRVWLPLVMLVACWIPVAVDARETVSEMAHRIAKARKLDPASYAFFVLLPDGQMFGHREIDAMKPASCLKLLTAALALDGLGPEAMFETDLRRGGTLENGVLRGDLYVVGRGDPNRPSSEANPLATLERWAATLQQLGITSITGNLVGDDSFFAGPVRHPDWPKQQWHKWYSAPCGALNLNDNCVDVTITPTASRVDATLFPANRLLSVRNELRTVSSAKEHRFSIDRRPGSWEVVLRGKFLSPREPLVEWITVEHPTLAYLGAFAELLSQRGIQLHGALRRGDTPADTVLIDRVGHSVAASVPRLIKRSLNLHGDCMLRHLDRVLGGDGSFASAGVSAAERLRTRFEWSGPLVVRDGSGLSHGNRVNARGLVGLLLQIRRTAWGPIIRDALPVAGVDGTLKRRFRSSGPNPRIRAKTGHLNGVSSLAGYLDTPHGEVVFALLFNGQAGRTSSADRWQEDLLVALDSEFQSSARPAPAGAQERKSGG